MAAYQVNLGTLELVEWPGLGRGSQLERAAELAGLEAHLRRGQHALGSSGRIDRQLDGASQERRRRGDAAARLRAASRAFELGGDLLVGARGGAGAAAER